MIFNQMNYPFKENRDVFRNAVNKIFGDSMTFLDFLENEEYSAIKYDCYLDYNGENYIIKRETGEYINWYKLDHIGRCINISTLTAYENIPKWFEEFLDEFKKSGSEEYKRIKTYGDIYKEFCDKFPNAEVEDYRPAVGLYMPQLLEAIPNAIIVWLKDGSKIIYISESEDKNDR